jgi:hypothetical protein
MLQQFSKKYGPISSMKFGMLDQVLIDDTTLIREILGNDNFRNRPINTYIQERSYGKSLGILWGRDQAHLELRRFSLRKKCLDVYFLYKLLKNAYLIGTLRDFG